MAAKNESHLPLCSANQVRLSNQPHIFSAQYLQKRKQYLLIKGSVCCAMVFGILLISTSGLTSTFCRMINLSMAFFIYIGYFNLLLKNDN